MEPKLLDFVAFRQMEEPDYNFVLSNWAHSYKGSPWAGTVPNNLWHVTVKESVDQLVARGAYVVLAVSEDDRDQFLGFICWEEPESGISVVHYAYVKDEFREKHGVGRALLRIATKGRPFFYTHRTSDARWLVCGCCKYLPAIARRKALEPVYVEKDYISKKCRIHGACPDGPTIADEALEPATGEPHADGASDGGLPEGGPPQEGG